MEISADEISTSGIEISANEIEDAQPERDEFARQVQLGARDVAEASAFPALAVGDVLNAGVDFATGAVNKFAGTKIPKLGPATEAFSRLLTDIGLPEPESGGERIASDIRRGAAGAMAFGAAGPATSTTRVLGEQMAKQVVGGASAGLTSGTAREAGASPLLQFGAGVAGGVVGSALTPSRSAKSSRMERTAGKHLKNLKEDRPELVGIADDTRASSAELEQRVDGLMLGEAARSQDPGLVDATKRLNSQNARGLARASEIQNTAAVQNHIKQKIIGTGKPEDFSNRINQIKAEVYEAEGSAQAAVYKAVSDTSTTRAADAIGRDIRSSVAEKKLGLDYAFGKAKAKVDMESTVSSTPIVESINAVFGGFDQYFSKISALPSKILGRAAEGIAQEDSAITALRGKGELTIGELAELNSSITSSAREASAAGQKALARNLYKVKDGIESALNQSQNPHAGRLQAYWRAYEKHYVPKIKQGATARVRDVDRTGAFSVSDELVGAEYFKPGKAGISAAKDYQKLFGKDIQDIVDYATEDLLHKLETSPRGYVDDGVFNSWKARYDYALKEYGLTNQFSTLESSLKSIGQMTARRKAFDSSVFAKLVDIDPMKAMDAIMGSTKTAGAIVDKVKSDPAAFRGLKSIAGQWFESKITNFRRTTADGTSVYDGQKIKQFYADKENILRKIYSDPDEIAAFHDVRTALSRMSLDSRNIKSSKSPYYQVLSGVVRKVGSASPLSLKFRFGRAIVSPFVKSFEDAVNGLVEEAMFNPEKAAKLYRIAKQVNTAKSDKQALELLQKAIIRQAIFDTSQEGE